MRQSKKEQKTKTTEAKPTTRQASKQAKVAPNAIKKPKVATASQAVVAGPRNQKLRSAIKRLAENEQQQDEVSVGVTAFVHRLNSN